MEEINEKLETLLKLDKSINPQELRAKMEKLLQEHGESAVLEVLNKRIDIRQNPPDMQATA